VLKSVVCGLKVVLNTFMASQARVHKFVLSTQYLATAQPLSHQEIDRKLWKFLLLVGIF